jgi:hypothetical protein
MDTLFFLPHVRNFENNLIGYPQTLMPLDVLAIRWLYRVSCMPSKYINRKITINPKNEESISEIIMGKNIKLVFGENTTNVSFYLSKQQISQSNLEPVVFEYNRVLNKPWGFYPRDVDSTISTITFNNSGVSNLFIEKGAIKRSLNIRLLKNASLNVYVRDSAKHYKVCRRLNSNPLNSKTILYQHIKNKYFIKIKNISGAQVNVVFSNHS